MITPDQERALQERAGVDYSGRGTHWQTLVPTSDGWTGAVLERHRSGDIVSTQRLDGSHCGTLYDVGQLDAVKP